MNDDQCDVDFATHQKRYPNFQDFNPKALYQILKYQNQRIEELERIIAGDKNNFVQSIYDKHKGSTDSNAAPCLPIIQSINKLEQAVEKLNDALFNEFDEEQLKSVNDEGYITTIKTSLEEEFISKENFEQDVPEDFSDDIKSKVIMEVQDVIIDSCQDKLDKLENKLCKSKNDALAVLKIDLVQKFDLLSNKIEKLEDAEKKFTEKFQSDEVNPINTCTTNGNGRTKIKTKNHNCSPTVKINSNAEMESKKRKISTSLILDSNSNSINEPAAGLEENGHLRQQISHSDITKALSCNQNLNKKDDETENKQNNKIIDVCEQAKKIMYGNEALTKRGDDIGCRM